MIGVTRVLDFYDSAPVSKMQLITDCKVTIVKILDERASKEEAAKENIYTRQMWWWNHLGRWIGLKVPSEDSINQEYNESTGPHGFFMPTSYFIRTYRHEELEECQKLLRLAEITPGDTIYKMIC